MKNQTGGYRLSNSNSLYLSQHADNPVNWFMWGDEAFSTAKAENKLIILSIGYSACHWCHVMEHESFEDTAVAKVMNDHFVSIKLDREERPDIDMVYMEAVQAMGLGGGWPLNVFLTPDKKPFYGGTYFPKARWVELLERVSSIYESDPQGIAESASKLTEGLQESSYEAMLGDANEPIKFASLEGAYQSLKSNFDAEWGGLTKTPKFILPSTWLFLIRYHAFVEDEQIKDHVLHTLDRIHRGGIYDHLRGGFARYSVDNKWQVPHFEKMLYDNGQLLSLYAGAIKMEDREDFRTVLTETMAWLEQEMLDSNGGFYSGIDADSEGEEGKFYVWDSESIQTIAGQHAPLISRYFDISPEGNWEGKNVLWVPIEEDTVLRQMDVGKQEFRIILSEFKKKAMEVRDKRIKPGLDTKQISGWNGLVLTGLLDAYQATGDENALALAERNYKFLTQNLIDEDRLYHLNKSRLEGYADDYACVIQGLIKYYETTFKSEALSLAHRLTDIFIDNFLDNEDGLFYYSSHRAEKLLTRKKELFDNVIPSSNSIAAANLIKIGTHLYDSTYLDIAKNMINRSGDLISNQPGYMSNWALASSLLVRKLPEIAIVGEEAIGFAKKFNAMNIPMKVISASITESDLPLLKNKSAQGGKTTIYVCYDRVCKLPVHTPSEALLQIR